MPSLVIGNEYDISGVCDPFYGTMLVCVFRGQSLEELEC